MRQSFNTAIMAIAALLAGSNWCQATPQSTAANLQSPEEAIAFLLFGEGYKDVCRAAYKYQSCPARITDRRIQLNDGTYQHSYKISQDYCDIAYEAVVLKSDQRFTGLTHLGSVRTIDVKFSKFIGKSFEFAFVFSGEAVENLDGRVADTFTYYHEYYAFSGIDFMKHSLAERDAMLEILGEYQRKYCKPSS